MMEILIDIFQPTADSKIVCRGKCLCLHIFFYYYVRVCFANQNGIKSTPGKMERVVGAAFPPNTVINRGIRCFAINFHAVTMTILCIHAPPTIGTCIRCSVLLSWSCIIYGICHRFIAIFSESLFFSIILPLE